MEKSIYEDLSAGEVMGPILSDIESSGRVKEAGMSDEKISCEINGQNRSDDEGSDDMKGAAMSDEETSDDEVVLIEEVKILKKYGEGMTQSDAVVADGNNDKSDILRLISVGLTGAAPTWRNVLVLNRIVVCILRKIENQVLTQLRKNADNQAEIMSELRQFQYRKIPISSAASFQKCGMPFFTMAQGKRQPKNEYTIMHQKLGFATPELHFKSIFCWSHRENKKLEDLVMRYYKENAIVKLERQTRKLVRDGDAKALKEASEKLGLLKKRGVPVVEDQVDWLRVSASQGFTYAPEECRAQWAYCVNPQINRSKWTSSERKKLNDLAKANYFQSWDKVAAELGTGRSGLQCCITFHRQGSASNSLWTQEDEDKLRDLMNRFKNKSANPLVKVCYFFEGKTLGQIRRRVYTQGLPVAKRKLPVVSPHSVSFKDTLLTQVQLNRKFDLLMKKSDNFTCEEDKLLLETVKNHGKDWTVVAKAVYGRQPAEVRRRYRELLNFSQDVLKSVTDSYRAMEMMPAKLDVWSILQLMWERRGFSGIGIVYGLPLTTMSAALQRLLRILECGHKHVLGPRYGVPRNPDQTSSMVAFIAIACDFLSTTFVPDAVADRLLLHPFFTSRPENLVFFLRGTNLPQRNPVYGRCLFPPNALTLVGARGLLSARGLLMAQAELPIPISSTVMKRETAPEDRLRLHDAKELLKSRMFSLFFLSLLMAKVAHKPGQYVVANECEKRRRPATKPLSKLQRKKMAKELNALRWKKQKTQEDKGTGESNEPPAVQACRPAEVEEPNREDQSAQEPARKKRGRRPLPPEMKRCRGRPPPKRRGRGRQLPLQILRKRTGGSGRCDDGEACIPSKAKMIRVTSAGASRTGYNENYVELLDSNTYVVSVNVESGNESVATSSTIAGAAMK